jgi:hypothetical protein
LVLVVKKQFTSDYAFRAQDKVKGLFGGKALDMDGMLYNDGAFGFGFVVIDRNIEAAKRGIG